MAFIVNTAKTIRNHWKKSIAFAVISVYGVKYAKSSYEDELVRRDFCAEARTYGAENIQFGQKLRKVTVLLNPAASGGKGKKLFDKNAAPLLYLAGLDVNVVKTEYEGQAKEFMTVLETKDTDAVVVAGGDGTLLEVVTGIMRKKDKEFRQAVPVGVIPLGSTNKFAKLIFGEDKRQVRFIAEAAMAVVRGLHQKKDVLGIVTADGKSTYGVSSFQMGVYRDADERKHKYWYFGPLKSRWTYLRSAMKAWPPTIMSKLTYRLYSEEPEKSERAAEPRVQSRSAWSWLNIFYRKPKPVAVEADEDEDDDTDDHELMQRDVSTVELSVLSSNFVERGEENSQNKKFLEVGIGPSHPTRTEVITEGWRRNKHKRLSDKDVVEEKLRVTKLDITPDIPEGETRWFNIDGESYEAAPVEIKLLRNRLNFFYNKMVEQS